MAKKSTSGSKVSKASAKRPASRSHDLTRDVDVSDVQQFSRVMSALMSDALSGAVAPAAGNLACNAAGKMLKAAEMQLKYGKGSSAALKLVG